MIRRYQRADYLIAPASTVLLEAFAAGVPAVSGWIAENQRNSLDVFEAQGLIANTGDLRLVDRSVLRTARAVVLKSRAKMARRQKAFIRASLEGTAEIVQELLRAL
jgi:spore coat polysaccharide biosynthesis predicted glycosyltransferase SpsG